MSKSFDFIQLYQNEYFPEEKINENFQKIEYYTNLSVVSKISSSTDNNIQSDCNYLIDANNDDYFSDKVNQIATYNNNLGWMFFQPKEGQIMYLQADGKHYKYTNNAWGVFSSGGQSGGTGENVDTYTKDEIDAKISNISTTGSVDTSTLLVKANNLSDLSNKTTARTNLGVYSTSEVDAKIDTKIDAKISNISTTGNIDTSTLLAKANNLSDLSNKTTARTNLGVYSTSEVDGNFVKKSANLSDITNKQNARNNLDVYAKSETYNRSKNLLDILDQDTACHNIGTLRDWEIRRVGDYKFSAQKTDHDNWLICNGRAVSRKTYADLFALIGTSCGDGDGSTTFNIPDFRNKTIWGANGNLNATLSAGLPNITGTFSKIYSFADQRYVSGCFTKTDYGAGNGPQSSNNAGAMSVNMDASKSNSIYGKSTTVQPPAICVNIFILAKA